MPPSFFGYRQKTIQMQRVSPELPAEGHGGVLGDSLLNLRCPVFVRPASMISGEQIEEINPEGGHDFHERPQFRNYQASFNSRKRRARGTAGASETLLAHLARSP